MDVSACEAGKVIDLVIRPVDVSLGLVGVVRVLRFAEFLACLFAFTLGAIRGRAPHESEREHDDCCDQYETPLHADTPSGIFRTWNAMTISPMPRTRAPTPTHSSSKADERPGYPIAQMPRATSTMPAMSVSHQRSTSCRIAMATTKSNVPFK